MESQPPSGSVDLVLEGPWAPLRAIDNEYRDQTVSTSFPAIGCPGQTITMTHDLDMQLKDCSVYIFTRPAQTDSFFAVGVDRQNNVARTVVLYEYPEINGDAENYNNSIKAQTGEGISLPTIEDLGELGEIVEAYIDSRVAEHAADIENI